ncbi:xanthine dehydrogenase YagS FAD-binding subunit [Paraburkholderia sp. WSM4175]|uniref:FAD binding domain-containing protein n=1 Tax=Paraburkholderia sp. WSM4175 TaxID=2991072 RepID=UPI003D24F009
MKNFEYARGATAQQVVASLAAGNVAIIAGGTELLNWMRLGIAAPDRVIDVGGLTGLARIVRERDDLVIGALTDLNVIGEDALVGAHASALAQACLLAASAQVRNRATLGGNVMQKTRCAYFRSETPLPWGCNKRNPGSGCPARNGINERHAIFGWTDACVAVQPSDPAVALACLDATAEVIGPNGGRMIKMTEFHLTQQEAAGMGGDAARLETRLAADEVIVSFHIPIRADARSAYVKVRERASYEYALVSAAASVELDRDRIVSARIALGSVAQRPWRLPAAEVSLAGQAPTKEVVTPIVDAAMSDARPLAHNGYKVTMARNAAVRALLTAAGRS